MAYNLKDVMVNKPSRLTPGHRMCAGCGGTITVNATAGKAMSRGGGNCKVASGTYDVYFDLSGKKIWVKTPGSAAPTK